MVPWTSQVIIIQVYASLAKSSQPPPPIEVMLGIHFLQRWNNYSDPTMDLALHNMPVHRQLAGLDSGTPLLPNEYMIYLTPNLAR